MKLCGKCNVKKVNREFYTKKHWCKDCFKEYKPAIWGVKIIEVNSDSFLVEFLCYSHDINHKGAYTIHHRKNFLTYKQLASFKKTHKIINLQIEQP